MISCLWTHFTEACRIISHLKSMKVCPQFAMSGYNHWEVYAHLQSFWYSFFYNEEECFCWFTLVWGMSVCRVVLCQAEVSASDRSLIQRSPTDCSVSECDHQASTLCRPCPTGKCRPTEKRNMYYAKGILFPNLVYTRLRDIRPQSLIKPHTIFIQDSQQLWGLEL